FRSSLARARHSPYNSRLLHSGAYSSVGQSSRLIIDWSQVQVLLGPPFPSVMSDLIGLFQPEITDFGRSSGAKLRFAKPRLHPAGLTISVGQRISSPNSAHGPGRPFDGLLRCGLFQFPGHQQHQQHAAEQADPGPVEGGGGVADEACQQGHEGGYGIAATLDEGQQCAGLGGRAGVVEGNYQLQREERAYTQPDQQYRRQHQLDGRDDQTAEAGEDDAEHQTQQWPAIGEAVYQGG